MSVTDDPLYGRQWHFPLLGGIETVWADYTGHGVVVAIYDDGVEGDHPDLVSRYDATRELAYVDGTPNAASDAHGTNVAGIVAADNNTTGGVGVAWGSTLVGVDYINDIDSYGAVMMALSDLAQFDVINASWGFPGFASARDIADPGFSQDVVTAVAGGIAAGRDGLGSVLVKSAGNTGLSGTPGAQDDFLNVARHGIVTGATDPSGAATGYSAWGVNLLIAAPAASVTTDLSGAAGETPGDDLQGFGGTSAAAPVVSGVVALMLEAAPTLGWRDIQQILAVSAAQTGSGFGAQPAGQEDGAWMETGSSGSWNGGALSYHINYGFGMVDAYAAVRMAEVWAAMHGPARTSANELTVSAASRGTAAVVPDAGSASHTITVLDEVSIESLLVEVDLDHPASAALRIELIAPDGTTFLLHDGNGSGAMAGYTYGVKAALGMASAGDWVVRATDLAAGGGIGIFAGATLHAFGAADSVDDVHHLTSDYADFVAVDPSRGAIADGNGGIDWINAAALTGDLSITLADAGALSLDGVALGTLVDGGAIENVATGDGADDILGNAHGNTVLSGRGDDVVTGGDGDDSIDGSDGRDSLHGGGDHDTVRGGAGFDTLFGGGGDDLLLGGDAADRIDGGSGSDTLAGERGNDRLFGQDGDDTLSGGDGIDRLFGQGGNDLLDGGAAGDRADGGGGHDTVLGGAGKDTLDGGNGFDQVRGEDGDDSLSGGARADQLYGGAGHDLIEAGGGTDVAWGGAGDDTILGGPGMDRLVGDAGDDSISGGDLADKIRGDAGDDTLTGDAGNDRITGGNGADVIDGGAGDDLMIGGSQSDTFVFRTDHGSDRIRDFDAQDPAERIDLSAVNGVNDMADLARGASQQGADVIIDTGGGNAITLLGVLLADLDQADFLF